MPSLLGSMGPRPLGEEAHGRNTFVSTSPRPLSSSLLVSMVWLGEEPVYPFGPATYRRRWDMLLSALGLGQCELTPGGLRGGGAVWAYHHGTAIADIQWRMRLKHQHTLVHYLQEVAALNALLDAGPDSRIRLRQVAELFPFVVLSF